MTRKLIDLALKMPPSSEQVEVSALALAQIIENDRYPLSPRFSLLKEVLGKLRPEPAREPLPPQRHYEPPSRGRYGRRR